MKKSDVLSLVILGSIGHGLNASEVDIPHNFTAGTAAVASEVNANFSEIETAVDDNHQKIVALQTEVDALQAENSSLLSQIEDLQNTQPSAIAIPVSPRGSSPNYVDVSSSDDKGVFTIQFNVALDPDTVVAGENVIISGAGGTGTGTISWTDNNSTLIYTMLDDFITIAPCFSGGLEFNILGDGDAPVQDAQGKAVDGDRDGLPGGDLSITYDILC